jgi:hypothetical protein
MGARARSKRTAHPQVHPAGRTYGLEDAEVEKLRTAARYPFWRYLLASRRFTRILSFAVVMSFCAYLFGHWTPAANPAPLVALGAILLLQAGLNFYDWTRKRGLARKLGYA